MPITMVDLSAYRYAQPNSTLKDYATEDSL